VPGAFDDWVADPRGQFTVALDGEVLAGFGKLTETGAAEWWLEGLRVDPRYRGQGVARLLHEYAVALADDIAEGTLRFATSSENAAVHKLAQESGFRLVSEHFLAEVGARPVSGGLPFRPVSNMELPEVRNWLVQSPNYTAAGGLLEDDWVWLEIAPRLEGRKMFRPARRSSAFTGGGRGAA
jgi:hypothetical protein